MQKFIKSILLVLIGMALALSWTNFKAKKLEPVEHEAIVKFKVDPSKIKTTGEAKEAMTDNDWRDLDPENTVYLELDSGRVIMELAPGFAPNHVTNLKTLVRENYFDRTAIIRSHENYVAQWGDPAEEAADAKGFGSAAENIAPEWEMPWQDDLPFFGLMDGDVYAPEAGISSGFPVAANRDTRRIWLTHCYGMLGVGRGNELDSGNSSSLYVVTGHAPRHLDKNVTLIGRVIQGMELLTTLPRGTGPLGFYETPAEHVPIISMRLASDVTVDERTNLQIARTDTAAYADFVDARRYRKEDWFNDPAGRIELCNVPVPVRETPSE